MKASLEFFIFESKHFSHHCCRLLYLDYWSNIQNICRINNGALIGHQEYNLCNRLRRERVLVQECELKKLAHISVARLRVMCNMEFVSCIFGAPKSVRFTSKAFKWRFKRKETATIEAKGKYTDKQASRIMSVHMYICVCEYMSMCV